MSSDAASAVLDQLEGLFLTADADESGSLEAQEVIKVVGQYYRAGAVILLSRQHPTVAACPRSSVVAP